MITDKALANSCISFEMRGGGDTGRGWVEHRSFKQLRTTLNMLRTGYNQRTPGQEYCA